MSIKHFLFIGLFGYILFSCTKLVSIVHPSPVASLTVVNAVDGSGGLLTTFWPDSAVASFYSTSPNISYGSANEYGVPSGTSSVIIYDVADTTEPIFSGTPKFGPDSVYSLFLSGPSTTHSGVDTLLVFDNPPYHPVGDSSMGIRFVNVSPSAGSISVDLRGNDPGSEVASLAYQGVTSFKNYAATSTVPNPSTGYVFEFRSVANDSVLYTYTYPASNLPCFENVSLVLGGTTSGSGFYVFEVNNY